MPSPGSALPSYGQTTPVIVGRTRPRFVPADTIVPTGPASQKIADLAHSRRRTRPGEYLFRMHDHSNMLYLLATGFVKTCYVSVEGREQITGFHLRGDILGLDAIGSGCHNSDAVALEACELLVVPYEEVIAHGRHDVGLLHELHRALCAEICNDRLLLVSLGSLHAAGRVAAFLLELSRRRAARGYSATRMQLQMSREEIGSLLGLKLETVSRAFSSFARQGLITVYLREVELLDRNGLRTLIDGPSGSPRVQS